MNRTRLFETSESLFFLCLGARLVFGVSSGFGFSVSFAFFVACPAAENEKPRLASQYGVVIWEFRWLMIPGRIKRESF